MSDCTATLTTAIPTDDVVAELDRPASIDAFSYGPCFWDEDLSDGVAVLRDGDGLLRLDLVTLTCDRQLHNERPDLHYARHSEDPDRWTTWWSDDMGGATPHTPTTGERHVQHARSCSCLGDSDVCCDPKCCTPPTDKLPRHGFWPSAHDRSICGRAGCATRRSHPIHLDNDPPPADVCPVCKGAKSVSSGYPPHPCSACGGSGRHTAVTDAEVEAARAAYLREMECNPYNTRPAWRAALEAAHEASG